MTISSAYCSSLVRCLLLVLLFMCFSDVYIGSTFAIGNNLEEIETLELKDQLEEEEKLTNKDFDEDPAFPLMVNGRVKDSLISISFHRKSVFFVNPSGVVLPPPER